MTYAAMKAEADTKYVCVLMLQSTSIESLFGFSTSADTLLLLHPTTVFRPYPPYLRPNGVTGAVPASTRRTSAPPTRNANSGCGARDTSAFRLDACTVASQRRHP